MRFSLRPASRLPSVPLWAAATAAAWGAGVLVLDALWPAFPTCKFHAVTGVPCPACGGTRAVSCAIHGDVGGAFAMNPLLFATLAAAAVLLLVRLATARRVSLRLDRGEAPVAWLLLATLVAADWAYLVARGI